MENLNEGTEIAYRGPYSLCCSFFDGSNCSWEGEYPQLVQVGGCPILPQTFSSTLRRPLWIKSAGMYKAEVKLFSEEGEEISCFEVMAELNRTEEEAGGGGKVSQESSLLVPMAVNKTTLSDEDEVSARDRTHRRKIVHQGDEEIQVEDEEFHALLAAGRNWTGEEETRANSRASSLLPGIYRSASTCGPGCCCLNDDRVEFTFVEKVRKKEGEEGRGRGGGGGGGGGGTD
eukprot:765441-Hanusia_phi.AAC.8